MRLTCAVAIAAAAAEEEEEESVDGAEVVCGCWGGWSLGVSGFSRFPKPTDEVEDCM
jgi:hypothetical protein